MIRFLMYGLLVFLLIQLVRTTMRIRSNVRKSPEEEEEEGKPKPPVLNIPDIQEAKFEDLTGTDDKEKDKPKETPPSQ